MDIPPRLPKQTMPTTSYPFPSIERTAIPVPWQEETTSRLYLIFGNPQTGKTTWARQVCGQSGGSVLYHLATQTPSLLFALQSLGSDLFLDLPQQWQAAEETGPLWLILDQVSPKAGFWDELTGLVRDASFAPRGGILLLADTKQIGYLEAQLEGLPHERVFFFPPTADELTAALTYWTDEHGVSFEVGLADRMVKEFIAAEHPEPLFSWQTLLYRFWEQSLGKGVPRPVWSISMYKKIIAEGIDPVSFAHQQTEKLAEQFPDLAQSGALLHLLSSEALPEPLRAAAIDLLLLQEDNQWRHPYFAQAIQERHARSGRPLQVIQRIAAAKRAAKPSLALTAEEIKLWQAHQEYLPNDADTTLHLRQSHRELKRNQRGKRRWRLLALMSLCLLLLLGVGGYWQYLELTTEKENILLRNQSMRSDFLAFIAERLLGEQPTAAVRVAAQNTGIQPLPPAARRALYRTFFDPTPYQVAQGTTDQWRQVNFRNGQITYLTADGQAQRRQATGGQVLQHYTSGDATASHLGTRYWWIGTKSGKVQVFDLQKDTADILRIEAHPQSITQIEASPDETRFFTFTQNGEVSIWDTQTGQQRQQLSEDLPQAHRYRLYWQGNQIWATADSLTQYWDTNDSTQLDWKAQPAIAPPPEARVEITDNALVRLMEGDTARVLATAGLTVVEAHLSEQRIVLRSRDHRVLIFDRASLHLIGEMETRHQDLYLDGELLLVVNEKDWAVWRLADKAARSWPATCRLLFDPAGKGYVLAHPEAQQWIAYTLPDHEPAHQTPWQAGEEYRAQFLPSGRYLMLSTNRYWDTHTGELLSSPTPMQISHNGMQLQEQTDGRFFLNDRNGIPRAVLKGEQARWHPNRDSVWVRNADGLTLWNSDGDTVLQIPGKWLSINISHDGQSLILTEDRQNFTAFRHHETGMKAHRTYALLRPAVAHLAPKDQVLFVAYHPDPKQPQQLLQAYVGDTPVRPPESYLRGNLRDLMPTPDGKYIIAANEKHCDFFDWKGERRGSTAGRFLGYYPDQGLILTMLPNQFLLGDAYRPGTFFSRSVIGLQQVAFAPDLQWIAWNENERLSILPASPETIQAFLERAQILPLSAYPEVKDFFAE